MEKAVLVTGANKGIGYAIVEGLVAAGVPTFLGARNVELGEAAKAALAPLGYSIQARARGRSRLRVRGPAERRDLDISKYD